MRTRAQQHKSKIAQIACAVAAYALAPIQSAMGLTAGERFRAMHNLNDGGVMKSQWFTAAMLLVLAGSITALIIVTLYRKLREGKEQIRLKTQDIRPKIEELGTQNSKPKTDSIEQRVSNIEKQVSTIEKRLTKLEQEVSSFEVIEDESNQLQPSADTDGGTK
jgi:hypothetical protein